MAGIIRDKIIEDFVCSAEVFILYLMCSNRCPVKILTGGFLEKCGHMVGVLWHGRWTAERRTKTTPSNKLHVIFNSTFRP